MAEILMTVGSKGQVTIPASVRRYLKLKKNQKIALILEADGSVRLQTPRYSSIADLSGAAGVLGQELSWSEMLAIAYDDRKISRPRRKRS
jgi:AbrB family looped-hinge helix DNA binding protein